MAVYIRCNVDTSPGAYALISTRLGALGHSTRAARAAALGVSESALGELERGERVATALESETIRESFGTIGVALYPDALETLPLSAP